MIFDGCHFEYGNFNSRQYDLVFAHLDTSIDTRLSGDIETQYLFSKKSLSRHIVGNDYSSSPVTMEVEIITAEPRALELYERKTIEKALFNRKSFRRLYIDMADDFYCESFEFVNGERKRLYLNCRFMNPTKIEDGAGRVVGYRCTMDCESLMFTQELAAQNHIVYNGSEPVSSNITVSVDTDLDEYIYPKVKIQMGSSGGNVIIVNNSDDSTRQTKFLGLGALATVVMKGELNYVSGQYYEKFAERNFIRLLDGENVFTVTGDVESIEFEYSVRRSL